jgi:pimeloyl-ACP methyl ester carboxylesterase
MPSAALLLVLLLSASITSARDFPHAAGIAPAQTTGATRLTVVADDDHPLALWTKSSPSPRRALLLLHGRTWSALPNFDLQVSGTPRSVMDALVHAGYAVYALDQRGYGDSARDDSGWLTPSRAAGDALAAIELIRARHGTLPAPAVIGYSQGAMTALLAAQRRPRALSALVLYGFPADLGAPPARTEMPAEPLRAATTAAAAGADFVVAGAASDAVVQAYVQQAIAADPIRVDWRALDEFRFEPETVTAPTLLLQGVADGYVKPASAAQLFQRLAAPDRSWVILPDSDHAAHVGNAQPAWIAAIVDFLERPRPALER